MARLTLDFRLPFSIGSENEFESALYFASFFPLGMENGAAAEENGWKVVIWFDEGCTQYQNRGYDLGKLDYFPVKYFNATVEIDGLSEEFLTYIQNPVPLHPRPKGVWTVESECFQFSRDLVSAVEKRVNRLIAAARIVKGQYWLKPCSLYDREVFQNYECFASIDDKPAFRFCPPFDKDIYVRVPGNERGISSNDWSRIVEFVVGESKPDLVEELLVGAERLAAQEHNRAALTEAVTALEVAIYSFARAPRAEVAFGSVLADRLAVAALKNQVSHLGLSGTINYLLPTVFSEALLPTDTLRACQEAVRQRQTVVHQGQREVEGFFLARSLSAIRDVCRMLRSVSQDGVPN